MPGGENPGDDAEGPVEHAGINHRIDMRADQQAPAPFARPETAHGAERILAHGKSRLFHPTRHHVGGAPMLRREEPPREPLRLGGNCAEDVDHAFGAGAERCGIDVSQFAISQCS